MKAGLWKWELDLSYVYVAQMTYLFYKLIVDLSICLVYLELRAASKISFDPMWGVSGFIYMCENAQTALRHVVVNLECNMAM